MRSQNKILKKSKIEFDDDLHSCIEDLFSPEKQSVGEEFFNSTILKLNKHLCADYVFIARVNEVENLLESVAFCDRNDILSPISFPMEGSLCQKVIEQKCSTFLQNIKSSDNLNKHFQGKDIKSYLAVPLYGSNMQSIGVLTALFVEPIINEKRQESLMYMFSSRIGSELEHMESERELKRRNLELLVFKEELIRKNKELDKMNNDLKDAKLKAEESNMLKSSFLANLSHEIRTPMNAIIGFTELLRSNNLSSEEKSEYLDIVHQNGNQLMRVMDAIIDISKLQAKAYVEPKQVVAINEVFNAVYDNFSTEISACKKPISLKLFLDANDGSDKLYTHKEALTKVFEHLLDNAIKFTREGEIVIGYLIYDDYYEFFIKDTGIGIPSGDEEVIFDLFRQADTNNTREFEGNGIGLSIVKKYVEIMKGKVWAEPNQTEGAMFKLQIPKFAD